MAGVGGLCDRDYGDRLNPKIPIWDFGLVFWNQTLNLGLKASDLELWTQACQLSCPVGFLIRRLPDKLFRVKMVCIEVKTTTHTPPERAE